MSWTVDPAPGPPRGSELPLHGVSIEVAAARLVDGRVVPGRLRLDRGGVTWTPLGRPGARLVIPLQTLTGARLVGAGAALELQVGDTAHRFGGDGARRLHGALLEHLSPEAA